LRTLAYLLSCVSVASNALAATATDQSSALATADQRVVESHAIAIFGTPAVKAQIARSKQLFLASPASASDEVKVSAERAVNEFAFAAALDAVNGDPQRPKIVWAFTAPRRWLGHNVPGSRWGIDNPDNVYRFVPIDGESKYELTVRSAVPGPVQYSFLVYDSFVGEDGRQNHLDTPITGLRDQDIKAHPDGSFSITIDSAPAGQRVNHLQTTPDARVLLIRNTFNDWAVQNPQAVTIRRIGNPTVKAPGDTDITQRTVEYLKVGTDLLLGWEKNNFGPKAAPNTLAAPFARGGGWGFAANGDYQIESEQALVVTLDPLGAQYVGFDLADPWLVSRAHIDATGSLNNRQAKPNADGSYTYVIATHDPGVANWLDTGGGHKGKILIRWQVLPEHAKPDGAVREVKLVQLSELRNALPPGFQNVSVEERKSQNKDRAASYAHRYAPGAAAQRVAEAK
jgi:hypothetical protein